MYFIIKYIFFMAIYIDIEIITIQKNNSLMKRIL